MYHSPNPSAANQRAANQRAASQRRRRALLLALLLCLLFLLLLLVTPPSMAPPATPAPTDAPPSLPRSNAGPSQNSHDVPPTGAPAAAVPDPPAYAKSCLKPLASFPSDVSSPAYNITALALYRQFTQNGFKIAMHEEEVKFLLEQALCSQNYFEWGTGGSTLLAALTPTIRTIVSVDALQMWQNATRDKIAAFAPSRQVQFVYVDIDADPHRWSYPIQRNGEFKMRAFFPSYSRAINRWPANSFDLVLVDGRFRVACALRAWFFMDPDARLFMHDCERTLYDKIRGAFILVEQRQRLCLYRKNLAMTEAQVLALATEFEFNWLRR
jgi:hypothetical protein